NLSHASRALRVTLPVLNPAIETGTSVLARTPPLNSRLQGVMSALESLAWAPGTNVAVNALTDTTHLLNPMIKYIGPTVTVCDGWNYWWTYLSEHLSERTTFGFAQRVMLMTGNRTAPNEVNVLGATAPVNGGFSDSPIGGTEHYHVGNYGAAVDDRGNADCE